MLRVESVKAQNSLDQQDGGNSDGDEGEDPEDAYQMTEVYNTGNVSGSVPILSHTGSINFFEKLMKISEEKSLSFLSERLGEKLEQYKAIMDLTVNPNANQHQSTHLSATFLIERRSIERQLAFLIKLFNRLFAQGLPCCYGKLKPSLIKSHPFQNGNGMFTT